PSPLERVRRRDHEPSPVVELSRAFATPTFHLREGNMSTRDKLYLGIGVGSALGLALGLLGLSSLALARSDPVALEAAANGHRAACEQLSTLHVKLHSEGFRSDGQRSSSRQAEFWLDGAALRWSETTKIEPTSAEAESSKKRGLVEVVKEGTLLDDRVS